MAFGDAICLLAGCPGAPLSPSGILPTPVSVPEGQNFLLSAPVVPGDAILFEDPAFTDISDILRFFAGGPIFLFSDDPGTEPSDTGIPIPGTNTFSLFEGPAEPIVYTAGVPGAQNTYLIFSDVADRGDVPEPGVAGMALLGLAAIALKRRIFNSIR
jgi:MYXO-CTERM domain-containing protein